jgi:anti-anti-sigma factor
MSNGPVHGPATADRPDGAADVRAQLDRERRENARLRRLTAAGAALSAAATPMEVAEVAVEQFGWMFDTASVAVFERRGPDSLDAMTLGGWVEGAREAWTTMPIDAPAPVSDAARTRAPVWTESALAWRETYPHLLEMLDGYGYTGVLGLPLVVGGAAIGALGIGFGTDRTLDDDEREDAVALADRVAHTLRQAQLLQVEADARRSAEQLTAMVAALSRASTPEQVIEAMATAAAAFGASSAVVAVRGPGDALELHGSGAGGSLDLRAAHPLAYAVRTGEPVWLARRSELAWRDRSFSTASDAPPVDLAVPMLLDDEVVGAIGMVFPGAPPHHSIDDQRTMLALAGQGAQALDRARLHQAEHDIAETLQRSLLPERLPDLATVGLAACYLPAGRGTQAGGDWYDVVELDGDRIAIVVGDVVGKGPAAAALMGQLRTAIAVSLLRGDGPAAALGQLDRFAARIPAARASSAVCLRLDHRSGRIDWASAGHPPPLLVTGSGTRLLWSGEAGPVLGLRTDRPVAFAEDSLTLEPGATLALYSDGLVERRTERLDDGLDRLARSAQRLADRPPAALAEALVHDLADGSAPEDDIALVVARLMPPPLTGRRPAVATQLAPIRRTVERWARAAALPLGQLDDLQFGMGEALANAVDHAYRDDTTGELRYRVGRLGDGSVAVEVSDSGLWRPVPEDPGHRGRGLQMIHAVGRDVDLRHDGTGTRIRFRVPPVSADTSGPAADREAPDRASGPVDPPAAGSPVRLPIGGEVDLAVATALRAELLERIDSAPPASTIEIDLRATTYIASAGVALLVHLAERARGRGHRVVALVEPGSAAARVLALTGVDDVLGYPGRSTR